MTEPQICYVKFIGNDKFISLVKNYAKLHPNDLNIQSETVEEDASRLGFDIDKAAAVATILSLTLYVGDLATRIPMWMSESDAHTIIIQTPYETIELHSSKPLAVEEVRQLLQSAQNIMTDKGDK